MFFDADAVDPRKPTQGPQGGTTGMPSSYYDGRMVEPYSVPVGVNEASSFAYPLVQPPAVGE